MPMFERDQVRINYEEHGEGFPILLIAPGGMFSLIQKWAMSPWNPIAELSKQYRVIAMDQRNAGESWAPITADDSWDTYTADQLALLDHLGVDRFHVAGMCIGGAYIGNLLKTTPDRIASAVVFQTIGLDDNRDAFINMFDMWAAELRPDRTDVSDGVWDAFRTNMYGGDDEMFTMSAAEMASVTNPLLVLMGNDLYHPESTSRLLAQQAPNATLVEAWKEGAGVEAGKAAVLAFLAENSPA